MKKLYFLTVCLLAAFAAMAQTTETYSGKVTIDLAGSGDITNGGQDANVEIIPTGDNTCTFKLPNFALDLGEGPTPLGDIVVTGVKVTEADGVKSYEGKVADMQLLDGAIVADVDMTGTVDADGVAKMTINVLWKMDAETTLPIMVEFNGEKVKPAEPVEPAASETYKGKVTIDLAGSGDITGGGQDANVEIIPTGDNTCTFKLPNFALDLGDGPTPLGDIVVPGVKVTEADGVKNYEGKVTDMQLLDGAIVADVDLTGTTDADGVAKMTINVLWKMDAETTLPIMVEFNGQLVASGVADIIVDENAPVEYYNLNGIRVANPENGVYIRRQGNKVTKVLVK